jgi:hypothetical protein
MSNNKFFVEVGGMERGRREVGGAVEVRDLVVHVRTAVERRQCGDDAQCTVGLIQHMQMCRCVQFGGDSTSGWVGGCCTVTVQKSLW